MTISAAGIDPVIIRRLGARGFTLVELMVVLIVLALLSGIVLTSLPRQMSEAQKAANQLGVLTISMSDAALLEGRSYGLDVEDGHLLAFRYEEAGWQRRPLPRELSLPDDIFLTLTLQDDFNLPEEKEQGELLFRSRDGTDNESEREPAPAVVFGPVGDLTPFTLRVSDPQTVYLMRAGDVQNIEVIRAAD